jgi:hypothetical protein
VSRCQGVKANFHGASLAASRPVAPRIAFCGWEGPVRRREIRPADTLLGRTSAALLSGNFSSQMSAWRASSYRLRRKPSVQSRSKTSFGEFVGVAITQFDLDPTIFDGLVQPSLEIGISHVGEIIASKYAARTNFVLPENAEDLAPYFFIRCHIIHPLRVSNRRSHKLNTTATGGMELYPSCFAPTR